MLNDHCLFIRQDQMRQVSDDLRNVARTHDPSRNEITIDFIAPYYAGLRWAPYCKLPDFIM